MILNVQIKFTTVFIGSRKLDENNNIRRIARIFGDDSAIKMFTRRIRQLFFKYATEELGIQDYEYDAIKLDGALRLVDPSVDTGIHIRKFMDHASGEEVIEKFEAYPCGTKMSFEVCIDESKVSVEQLEKILGFIGKYDGISQFGFNWGYGKFNVVSIEKVTAKEATDASNTSVVAE